MAGKRSATQGETALCWLTLCRSLADPFQEQGRRPPTPNTNSDALRTPAGSAAFLAVSASPREEQLQRDSPGPWAVLRCSSDRHWREGRGLFPFLVISGAGTVLGTQHTTSLCLLPRKEVQSRILLACQAGNHSVGMLRSFPVISGTDGTWTRSPSTAPLPALVPSRAGRHTNSPGCSECAQQPCTESSPQPEHPCAGMGWVCPKAAPLEHGPGDGGQAAQRNL